MIVGDCQGLCRPTSICRGWLVVFPSGIVINNQSRSNLRYQNTILHSIYTLIIPILATSSLKIKYHEFLPESLSNKEVSKPCAILILVLKYFLIMIFIYLNILQPKTHSSSQPQRGFFKVIRTWVTWLKEKLRLINIEGERLLGVQYFQLIRLVFKKESMICEDLESGWQKGRSAWPRLQCRGDGNSLAPLSLWFRHTRQS